MFINPSCLELPWPIWSSCANFTHQKRLTNLKQIGKFLCFPAANLDFVLSASELLDQQQQQRLYFQKSGSHQSTSQCVCINRKGREINVVCMCVMLTYSKIKFFSFYYYNARRVIKSFDKSRWPWCCVLASGCVDVYFRAIKKMSRFKQRTLFTSFGILSTKEKIKVQSLLLSLPNCSRHFHANFDMHEICGIPLSSARWRWVSIRNIEFQPSVYCPKLKQGWESRGRRVSFLISGSGLKAKQTRFPHCLLHYSSCCCRLRGAWRRHYESRRWFGWTVRECRPLKLQLCCFVLSDFDVTKQAEEQSRQRRLT